VTLQNYESKKMLF